MDVVYVWIAVIGLACMFVVGWQAGKWNMKPGGVLGSIGVILAIGIVVIMWKLGVGHV